MAQIKNPFQEARIPFAKMSFTPDVPSTALGPDEYNSGFNVETDVRGIRSVAGDQEFFDLIPGTPTFVTGGFRLANEWWFVVVGRQEGGRRLAKQKHQCLDCLDTIFLARERTFKVCSTRRGRG